VNKPKAEAASIKLIAAHKKARFDYHIIETVEAGIVLTGAEIKSVRLGGISIAESYVAPGADSLYLLNAHIKPYAFSGAKEYDPIRRRKLLLKKSEIERLRGRVEKAGLTMVPLQVYLKNGYAKVEIALAKGKSAPDKRETQRGKDAAREIARAMKGQRG
jgi:SsrA-binding protein